MILTLMEISELLPCRVSGDVSSEPLTGITTDSRTVKKGELFIAIRGEKFDGHAFVNNAFDDDAVAALVDEQFAETDTESLNRTFIIVKDTLKAYQEIARFYRRKMAPTVVALTGSAG